MSSRSALLRCELEGAEAVLPRCRGCRIGRWTLEPAATYALTTGRRRPYASILCRASHLQAYGDNSAPAYGADIRTRLPKHGDMVADRTKVPLRAQSSLAAVPFAFLVVGGYVINRSVTALMM
jgi:hypothetical protein